MKVLRRDDRGVAALEFVFAAPVLLIAFCGLVETSQLLRAKSKMMQVTDTLGTMVAHQTSGTSRAVLVDLCRGARVMMLPFGVNVPIAIASVTYSGGGPVVQWESDSSCGSAATPMGGAALQAARGMVNSSGDALIVVSSTYQYASSLHFVLGSAFSFSYTGTYRPTANAAVTCPDCAGS